MRAAEESSTRTEVALTEHEISTKEDRRYEERRDDEDGERFGEPAYTWMRFTLSCSRICTIFPLGYAPRPASSRQMIVKNITRPGGIRMY